MLPELLPPAFCKIIIPLMDFINPLIFQNNFQKDKNNVFSN
tara:strand:+ start:246 stop:368 length:123 start_codon:yes stop_codon:yes gene_type:complete